VDRAMIKLSEKAQTKSGQVRELTLAHGKGDLISRGP
jgi:hypothetical protein